MSKWDVSFQERQAQSRAARKALIDHAVTGSAKKVASQPAKISKTSQGQIQSLQDTITTALKNKQSWYDSIQQVLANDAYLYQKMYLQQFMTQKTTTVTGRISSGTGGRRYYPLSSSATTTTSSVVNTIDTYWTDEYSSMRDDARRWDGRARPGDTLELPDGSVLRIDKHGNYSIDDSNARVVYRANRSREFNPYLNASDLLAQFVEYCAHLGIKKSEFKTITVDAFIAWLIVSAAEKDGEEKPQDEVLRLEHSVQPVLSPRCLQCGEEISRERAARGINFCSGAHMDLYEGQPLSSSMASSSSSVEKVPESAISSSSSLSKQA